MSPRELSNEFFLKKIISTYYAQRPLEEPPYLHKREVALHSLEDNVYIRHLNFPSMKELYTYITKVKTPLHLYYSSAIYGNPSATSMDEKDWQGSELMFDIDADSFPDCNRVLSLCIGENRVYEGKIEACSDGSEPETHIELSFDCITRAFHEAVKLYQILREELGFRDIRAYFSGSKGFHIKVYDSEVYDLTSDERREILSYVKQESLNVNPIIPVTSKGYVLLFKEEVGLRKRLLNIILKYGLPYEDMKNYIRVEYDQVKAILQDLSVKVDPVVTVDLSRLSRFGYSLNCRSGLRVTPIDFEKTSDLNLSMFNPWSGYLTVKPLIDASLNYYGVKFKLRRGEETRLPALIGVYLLLKRIVVLIDTRDFGVS
ncbi:MAG: DNA primase small subunit domain-containing protein [Desulfurococcaceae archaeon]